MTVLTAALMYGLARAFPATRLPDVPFLSWLAFLTALSGVAVGFLGVWTFYRHRTTVSPTKPSSASPVVRSGVYRVTRNPMYLGLALLYKFGEPYADYLRTVRRWL